MIWKNKTMNRPCYEANKAFYFLVKNGSVPGLEIINGHTYVVNNGGNIFRGFARRVDAIHFLHTLEDDNYYFMTAGEENRSYEITSVWLNS